MANCLRQVWFASDHARTDNHCAAEGWTDRDTLRVGQLAGVLLTECAMTDPVRIALGWSRRICTETVRCELSDSLCIGGFANVT
jgi:hypothetical protein